MKVLAALFLTTLALPAQPVFLGTAADGIYRTDFNPETGRLSQPERVAAYRAPGFLALHPSKPLLYAVGGKDQVAAFAIGNDHSLELLGEAPSGGGDPCHLAIDATGQSVIVANYSDGSFVSIRLKPDGTPGEMVSKIKLEGSGPNASRQQKGHTHGVYFDRANRFVFAPDLGIDQVMAYRFDPATSSMTPNAPDHLSIAAGSGPRHMAFSPDEKHAYVINELLNTITVASYDAEQGRLETVQTIGTLPEDFTAENTTSEIEVHPNGKFVYGSNRGHNSIVVYQRDPETGKLILLQYAPCGGEGPRHFKIDPTGKWLICGHQGSNSLSVLSLDPATGRLGKPEHTVNTPSPICIVFR